MVKSFKNFLLEKLSISQYREIVNQIGDQYKNRYKDWFDGKWRIYLELDDAGKLIELPDSKKIHAPKEITNIVSEYGYKIDDYVKGIASKDKKIIKIGKLLQRAINDNKEDESLPKLLKKFNERLGGKIAKDTSKSLVVISRHPYDIAGMSTDRGWKSCKMLGTGINAHYIPVEIDAGVLVAYQIKSDDLNIQNPQGRILIVPYFNILDNTDTFLYAVERSYGSVSSNLRNIVQLWLNKKQHFNMRHLYCVSDEIYNDEFEPGLIPVEGEREGETEFAPIDSTDFFQIYRYFLYRNREDLYYSTAYKYIDDQVYDNEYFIPLLVFRGGVLYGAHGRGIHIKNVFKLDTIYSYFHEQLVEKATEIIEYLDSKMYNFDIQNIIKTDRIKSRFISNLKNLYDQFELAGEKNRTDDIISFLSNANESTKLNIDFVSKFDFILDRLKNKIIETFKSVDVSTLDVLKMNINSAFSDMFPDFSEYIALVKLNNWEIINYNDDFSDFIEEVMDSDDNNAIYAVGLDLSYASSRTKISVISKLNTIPGDKFFNIHEFVRDVKVLIDHDLVNFKLPNNELKWMYDFFKNLK